MDISCRVWLHNQQLSCCYRLCLFLTRCKWSLSHLEMAATEPYLSGSDKSKNYYKFLWLFQLLLYTRTTECSESMQCNPKCFCYLFIKFLNYFSSKMYVRSLILKLAFQNEPDKSWKTTSESFRFVVVHKISPHSFCIIFFIINF